MDIDDIEKRKEDCLVLDIETSAQYPDGKIVDIQTCFDDYVRYAKVKWLGMYSYKTQEYLEINVMECKPQLIRDFIAQHNVIIGFNNEDFDMPIMHNNDLMPEGMYYVKVDCKVILGASNFQKSNGMPFKNRGKLMGYNFKKNSLQSMAEVMGLETQKGSIDYMVFLRNTWTPEETAEIRKYLRADIEVTKQMFDKLWDFWLPFTQFLSDKNIHNLSWIRSSIASLRYKGDCNTLNVEETYGDAKGEKEEMGGNVIEPKYEEARNVWYLDYGSLYPWIRNMFCIDNEIEGMTEEDYEQSLNKQHIFHDNGLFRSKGYYDISYQSPIALKSIENLRLRSHLKETDKEHPMIYAIKIYENAGYGALRSAIFEQIHTENAGWDICYIGQQLQEYVNRRMTDFGFETIAGDTDSIFVTSKEPVSRDEVQECLRTIIKEIMANVPYPTDLFKVDIENYIDYIMWPFDLAPIQLPDGTNKKNEKGRLIKEFRGKKKNYVYIYHKKDVPQLKIVGLPIIKDTATVLGPKILHEKLIPLMIQRMSCKFDKKEMNNIISEYIARPDAVALLAQEYKVKPALSYAKESQIQRQISEGYFNGQAGVISLIKNKLVGRAGIGAKYCTVEEAIEHKLTIEDLDLKKLYTELGAFVATYTKK